MKTLQNMCNDLLKCLDFKPNEKVNGVMGKKIILKFAEVKDPSTVICPQCKGSEGFRVVDHIYGIIWSCKTAECIKKNIYISALEDAKEIIPIPKEPKSSLKRFGVPEMYENATILGCHNAEHRNFYKEWALNPQGCVIMAGGSGKGKTYASVAILEHYRQFTRHLALFINLAELYALWLACPKENVLKFSEKLESQDILVLDDLGIRTPTDAFLDFLYLIINKRTTSKGKGTIITTNLTSKQILEKFGEAVYSRICSGKVIKFEGEDKRFEF